MKNKTTKKGFSMLENYLVLRYSFTKSHSSTSVIAPCTATRWQRQCCMRTEESLLKTFQT